MASQGFTQDMKQTIALSPKQLQSVSILQMDIAQLEVFINEQLEDNPLIEQDGFVPPPELFPAAPGWMRGIAPKDSDSLSALDFVPARDEFASLELFLRDQLERRHLPTWKIRLCMYVANSLDERGYLPNEEREALYSEVSFSSTAIDDAIAILQTLEPAGLAARDLRECLLLQLARSGKSDSLAARMVRNCLPDLAQNRLACLSKKLKRPLSEIQWAAAQIRQLNPKPGALFDAAPPAQYILPDVSVSWDGGKLRITVNDNHIGRLSINQAYLALMEETESEEVRSYLKEKAVQANWLFTCLDQRHSTLERCVRHIVEQQSAFFLQRGGRLKPLTLEDVAGLMGVHKSTVSRTIKGKYLVCEAGTLPLRYFFTNSVGGEGAETSSQNVKAVIQELIRQEDKRAPLSDQQIQQLLTSEQGISLSRRTVAKYRTALQIPPAGERRTSQ